jgi:hypothetical protein
MHFYATDAITLSVVPTLHAVIAIDEKRGYGQTDKCKQATLPVRSIMIIASSQIGPARRGCIDTNRPGIHPRFLNILSLVRTISTIS